MKICFKAKNSVVFVNLIKCGFEFGFVTLFLYFVTFNVQNDAIQIEFFEANLNVWTTIKNPFHLIQKKKLKQFFDFFCNIRWISGWCKAINGLSIFINQEFREIPFDTIHAQETMLLLLQVLVQWAGIVSIHIDLSEREKKIQQKTKIS